MSAAVFLVQLDVEEPRLWAHLARRLARWRMRRPETGPGKRNRFEEKAIACGARVRYGLPMLDQSRGH